MNPKKACIVISLAALVLASLGAQSAFAQKEVNVSRPEVIEARYGECPPIIKMEAPKVARQEFKEVPNHMAPYDILERQKEKGTKSLQIDGGDSLRQTQARIPLKAPTPPPSLAFDALRNVDNPFPVLPPDTEGDVGEQYYIQSINLVFQIYDKATGAPVLPNPLPNNIFFQGFGGACESQNDGDPIVLWDQQARRWIFSQFAITNQGHQCFAVSQTSDPTGAYHLYDFIVTPQNQGFNDYPKIGVWPDGYYLSVNDFVGQPFVGAAAVAFEKAQMLVGGPAQGVKFSLGCGNECFFAIQPSHWEGRRPPRPRAPNTFAMAFDSETWGFNGAPDGYRLWNFSVNWANPPASTFTSLGQVNTAEFDANLCNFAPCVPQLGTGQLLDSLSQFTMYRLQFRNFGIYETLVGNHTVDVGGNLAGVRWFELRRSRASGGAWGLHQAGTFSPADGLHRWMGSAAMDGEGNIAVGYSISSSGIFPGIRYTSRMRADALGTLPGGEQVCQNGGGSQSANERWGDYSSMSIDPVDDCKFWYTTEYYQASSAFNFASKVCAFSLSDCSCVRGTTSGNQFFLPGTDNPRLDGGMFDEGGTQIYLAWADLTETTPAEPGFTRQGEILGVVKPWPNWPDDPLYDLVGTWYIEDDGTSTWSATIIPVGADGPPLGYLSGTFDEASHSFEGVWQLCD